MRINTTNEAKITVAIEAAEGKSTARTLSVMGIRIEIINVERKLSDLEIPKKYWKGFSFLILPSMVPNSYKYTADGTMARIERGSAGWFMTSVRRSVCATGSRGARSCFTLTPEMASQISKSYEI